MAPVLPTWPAFGAFVAASLVLAITPGPGVIYVVARSLAHGRRSGLASVAGVALGNLGNALVASLGLAALIAVCGPAFAALKLVGAAYLLYLGVATVRARGEAAVPGGEEPRSAQRLVRDGFAVALLNPKTALFFAAFLPQFAGSAAAPAARIAALGALFVAIAAVTDSAYALLAGALAPALARRTGASAVGRAVSGGALIALGVGAALSAADRSR